MNQFEDKKYDLEERTARFAEEIIDLCKKASKNITTIAIINQLIRSGTSIGANYCEANGSELEERDRLLDRRGASSKSLFEKLSFWSESASWRSSDRIPSNNEILSWSLPLQDDMKYEPF